MFNIFKQFIPKFIFVFFLFFANNVFANESFSEPDTLVSFTATLPAGTTSARLHSEALSWDTSHPDGVASYNGDGTWTATIPVPWPAGTNYRWFVDGVEENLKDDVDAGYCANDGLNSGDWGANRVYSGSGDVTGEVFGHCSDTPIANYNDQIIGEWKLAPEAGAIGVGPSLGDTSWWFNTDADVLTRLCLFDDVLSFNADGSFDHDMQDAAWLEGWQGVMDGCGAPIAPHDGSNAATYEYNAFAGTLTVSGDGAHIGLSKVRNGGEDGVSGGSITYEVTELTQDTMTLDISIGGGYWRFKLVTADSVPVPVLPEPESEPIANDNDQIVGEWKLAPEAGAIGVGPSLGDTSWWFNTDADVLTRLCLFDDVLSFNADGSFDHDMQDATWLEGRQGVMDGCGAPIAPHDGSNAATYEYDAFAGTLTVSGDGAHIGLSEVRNGGEDGVSGGSITYEVTELTQDTMTLDISIGGGYWRFKLVTADSVPVPVLPTTVAVTFQVDMTAVDTSAGVSVMSGAIFGQAGLAMTDDDGDGIYTVTTDLAMNSVVMFKYRNTNSSTWENQESVPADCGHFEWSARQVVTAEANIVLDVVAFGSCDATPYVAPVITVPAAPAPTDAIDSVLSVFSTTYGNLAGTNWFTDWGQSTQVTVGDVLSLENLNYQGIEFSSEIDVSGYEYLNVSYYVIESIPVNFYLVSPSGEKSYALDVSTVGEWNNVQIPLSHYDNVNLADVIQLKVNSTEYCWNNNCLIAFSNIYFGGVNPEKYLADFEEEAESYVIDGFDGGLASIEEAPDGTNSLKYVKGAGATWAGVWINLENAVDVANGEIITADVYSTVAREITLKFDHANVERVVSHGGTGWESLSYDFTGAMPGDQEKIVFFNDLSQPGDGTDAWTIYIDNLAQTTGGDTPATVFVTFQVDMTAVETNADGVYIAGGNFGQDGFLLTDDGSDVWRTTVSVNTNTQVIYKFRNQPSYGGWNGFEDSWFLIDGGCVTGDYYDRFVDIAEANIVLDVVAFGSCTADAPGDSGSTAVTFTVTAPAGTTAVRLHSEIFGWDPNHPAGIASDNGDGTWSLTLYLAGTNYDFFYNWVVDGVQEQLRDDIYAGYCANDDLLDWLGYPDPEMDGVNRWFRAGTTSVTDIAGNCSDSNVLIDFEEEADAYEIVGFDGGLASIEEAPDGTNSLKYVKNPGYHWAGVFISMDPAADLVNGTVFTADIHSTVARYITMKFEGSNVEMNAFHTGQGWENLKFDFTDMISIETQTRIVFFNALGMVGEGGDDWTIYIDNIFQSSAEQTLEIPTAPEPEPENEEVLSLFSNKYGQWEVYNFNPDWGQSTEVTVGDDVLTFTNLDYQGIEIHNADVSGYEYLHIDFYTNDSSALDVILFSEGAENGYSLDDQIETGHWFSVDIPLENYIADLTNITQLKFVGNGTVLLDNIYFGAVAPTPEVYCAAPVKHFNIEADTASAVLLTIERVDANNIDVSVSSADADPIDLLIIGVQEDPATAVGAMTLDNGTATIRLTYDAGAPDRTKFEVLWSKESTDANWMLRRSDLLYVDTMYSCDDFELEAYGGASIDGSEYIFPTGAESWSGFGNINPRLYPITVAEDSVITFTGSVPSGGDAVVRFRFEANLYPNTEPSFNTGVVLVSGSEPATYSIAVPFQGANTFNSFIMYLNTRDVGVSVTDIAISVDEGGDAEGPEPVIPVSPVPTDAADSVLSIFSNTYGNLPGIDFNPNWGQETQVTVGDVLTLENLNYQGIQLPSEVDVSGYGYLHLDIFVDRPKSLEISLIGPDTGYSERIYLVDILSSDYCGWQSIRIPLNEFIFGYDPSSYYYPNFDLSRIYQFKFVGIGKYHIGNMYFGGEAPEEWSEPNSNPAPAIKIYDSLPITHFGIGAASESTVLLTVERVDENSIDVSVTSADTDPVDFMTIGNNLAANISSMSLVDGTATITLTYYSLAPLLPQLDLSWSKESTEGNWALSMNDFRMVSSFVACEYGGTPPPPEPNPEGEVLSIFSDTLGNMSGANFYAQWGQATQVTVSDVLTYSNLDYQGIEIPDTDVSNYEHLHIDFYTNDLSALSVRLSSHPEGATTNAISLTDQIVTGQWVSVEIPIVNIMTGFDSANKSVNQLIFEGNGTVLLGNIYFGEVASPKGYCAAPVTHSNIEAETASAVLLTVDRVDANSIDVSVTSADTDPVDFLMIEIPYAQNVQISDMTLDDGTATVTLTWFDVAPDSVSLDVFWSKESSDVNWMLRRTDLSYIDTSYGCDEFVFSEYGGASIVGSEYITPTDAASWAGFANFNLGLYPITFNEHSVVTFTAFVPSGEDALVSFRFEANPYPDIRPFFKTLRVKVSGDEPATYSACVPSQGDNLFNSVQMYLETRDVAVVIDNVSIESDASCTSADPITPEFLAGAPSPTINQDEVVSFFSDQYTSSFGAVYPEISYELYGSESEIRIDNENTIKRIDDFIVAWYPLLLETSIEDKTMLSVSLYSQTSFDLEIRLSFSDGGGDMFYNLQSHDMPVDQWVTVDIDLSENSESLSNIRGLGFATNDYTQTIYVDDIYFHNGPTEPSPEPTSFTVRAPENAQSVSLISSAFDWSHTNPEGVASDNGDGTWTVILPNTWTVDTDYKWVITFDTLETQEEDLTIAYASGFCDNDDLNSDGTIYAQRWWRVGQGDVTNDIFGECTTDKDEDGVADMHDFAPQDPNIWAKQTLTLSGNPIGNIGQVLPLEIEYDVSNNNNQLSGTGFRLHYSSDVVSIESFENLLSKDMVVEPTGPFVDLENYDNDELTDEYYLFGWASLLGDWPSENLPAKLMTVQLNLLNNHQFNTTSINISKSSSPIGYEFEAEPFNLELEEKHTWDFDQDGQVDALTDGLILMRHGFSLSGENLIRDATNNPNITHQDVMIALEDAQGIIDIDGNGHFDALTDGLILMRYLFGLSGENLIHDVISTSANRVSATEITSYIQLHMP